MKSFKDYCVLQEWSFWQNFVVRWTLQPHKFPFILLASALGAGIGTGVGALKGIGKTITNRDPLAIPKEMGKGAVRWGTGLATQWGYTPQWAENTTNIPPEIQAMMRDLEQRATRLKLAGGKDPQLVNDLAKLSAEFTAKVQSLPDELKQQLMTMIQQ